jgi:predicted RND superfamily exporter protein
MEGVESVISEATLFTIKNNQAASKFEIFRVFSDITYREKSIDSIRKEVKAKPIFKGLLYNEKGNVSLMMVTINEDFLTSKSKSQVVVNIENLAKTYQTKIGKIHFGGLPHLRVEISNRIMFEMLLFIGLSMLVTSSLLYFFFRSFRVVIMCGIIVAVTVVWAMGEIAVMDFKLTILMALIPPLMIVIGIPNCIFLMTKFHQEVKEHGNKVKALSNVIQKTGTATFLTNFTIAIGFGTFAFTNSEKLMEFGMVASFNIMMVFVLTMCLMPIYISFLDTPEQRHLKHLDRKFAIAMVGYIVHIVQRRRTLIYVLTILVIIVSVLGFSKIKTTGNLTSDLPKNDTILQDVKFMEKNFGGSIPFEIMVSYKERGRLFKGSTMERVEEVQEMFAQDSLFSKTISPIDFVKAINMAYYNNNPEKYCLISNRDKLRLKRYMDNLSISNTNGGGLSLKELLDTNLVPSDWIYDNVFKLSEDQYDELRDLVIEDKKRTFRLGQIENEGNDPAKSGKSYGTPHDLAFLYGKGRMGSNPENLPAGYDENVPLGRPSEKASDINTQDNAFGRDRLGLTSNQFDEFVISFYQKQKKIVLKKLNKVI